MNLLQLVSSAEQHDFHIRLRLVHNGRDLANRLVFHVFQNKRLLVLGLEGTSRLPNRIAPIGLFCLVGRTFRRIDDFEFLGEDSFIPECQMIVDNGSIGPSSCYQCRHLTVMDDLGMHGLLTGIR